MAERLVDASGAPPPITWLVTAFFAALILSGLWLWVSPDKTSLFLAGNRCLDALQPNRSTDRPSVIAFGSSLLPHAIAPFRVFEANLHGISFRACWLRGATWGDFGPTVESIERTHPTVLLLQVDLLEVENPTAQTFGSRVWSKLRSTVNMPAPTHDKHPVCNPEARVDLSVYEARWGPQPAVREKALVQLRSLKASGIRIILLDIPRSESLEAHFSDTLSLRRASLRDLAAKSGAAYWLFDQPDVPGAYCSDARHLSLAGSQVFSQQLAKRLQDDFESSRQ